MLRHAVAKFLVDLVEGDDPMIRGFLCKMLFGVMLLSAQ